MTIEKIYPEYIHLDGGTQPRARIDPDVCKEYEERMKAGDQFPPIIVFYDGQEYWLVDGFHRHQAHVIALPGEAMDCEVHQGTREDAQWYSYSVNRTHGLKRTNADKERAVRAALAHPQSQNLSDSAIADHVGVRRETVLRYRKKSNRDLLQSHKSDSSDDEATDPPKPGVPPWQTEAGKQRPRTGRDGRTINTAKIGRSRSGKKRKPRSPTEAAAARQNGRPTRFESTVKLELPNNNYRNCAYDLLEHFTFEYLEKVFREIAVIHQQRLKESEHE